MEYCGIWEIGEKNMKILVHIFQLLGVLCTQGPQTSAKNPNFCVKNWGQKSIRQKTNLNRQFIQFYF